MNGHNKKFLANPKRYLEQHAIECYNIKETSLGTALTNAGANASGTTCNVTLEFDLQPQPGKYVSMVILGTVGTYGGSSRKGRPIVGAWMPYLGQTSRPDLGKIGRINLDTISAHTQFVFTAGLGGCNFVVARDQGHNYLYHEPTADEWGGNTPNYPGTFVSRTGPAYTPTVFGGFGLAMRWTGGWKLLFQTTDGVRVVGVSEHAV